MLFLCLFLELVAAAVVRDIALRADKSASVQCIDVSLSYPRWEITNMVFTAVNYSSGNTIGDVAFTARNVAINLTTNCWAEDIELSGKSEAWHACTVPGTDFQFSMRNYELNMRGSWDCGDSRLMQFKAGGLGSTAGIHRCDDYPYEARGWETRCIMDDSSIPAGLTSPVTIDPTQPAVPAIPEARARSCTDRSDNPSWTISSLGYIGNDVSINVTNLANDQQLVCGVKGEGSKKWLDCVDKASTNIVTTALMFDAEHGILGLKQTWKCPSEPYVESREGPYTGIGYLKTNQLNLQCSAAPTSCTLPSPTILNGYSNAGPGIPHTSYIRSCTLNSFNLTSVTLQSYEISGAAKKTASFTLYNHGAGDSYRLSGVALQDDGAWHDCSPSAGMPWQLNSCRYALQAREQIAFRIQWDCDDRDPLHPIIFDAEASAVLPKEECSAETCGLAKESKGVELEVSKLTWTSSLKPMEKGPLLPWM